MRNSTHLEQLLPDLHQALIADLVPGHILIQVGNVPLKFRAKPQHIANTGAMTFVSVGLNFGRLLRSTFESVPLLDLDRVCRETTKDWNV